MVRDIVHQVLQKNGITGKERLVVGVSGGVDSMVLMHVLHSLDQPMAVTHVNYHRRGTESDADETLVRKSSELMEVPCYTRSVYYERGKGNFQDWARRVRYRFYYEIRQKTGAIGIATAHQRDDQIETILMKLMRGAGPLSWTGMSYWDGTYLRPLLDLTRAEIEQYAMEHEIPFRNDASNLESDYARNFLRNEWTPELDDRLPGWQQNILRLREWSLQMTEAMEVIERQLAGDDGYWNFTQFCDLPTGVQQAMIRYRLKKEYPGKILPSHGNLEEMSNICHLQSGQYVKIGAGLQLWRDRNRLVFSTDDQSSSVEKEGTMIQKEEVIGGGRIVDFARFSISDEFPREYGKKLYCLLRETDWPVTVRTWKDGDRFQPLGMEGHQLVSDFLTNRKVSSHRKNEALVVVSFDQKICAVIFPPSEDVDQYNEKGSGNSTSGGHSPKISHHDPGGIDEAVRCPDEPIEALIIEPIS